MSEAPLVVIGGAEQRSAPGDVLRTFSRLCGGPPATVAVCGQASGDPHAMFQIYQGALGQLGHDVIALRVEDLGDDGWRAPLERASGLFFTGGNQQTLVERVGRPDFLDALAQRRAAGMVVAGTSAGASALGTAMIAAGSDDTDLADSHLKMGNGFGMIDALIDQHFAQRGRINRLLAAVVKSGRLGIGIDEDTAIVVTGDRFEVIGEGTVTVIDGSNAIYHTSDPHHRDEALLTVERALVHVLEPGDDFDLRARSVGASGEAT